MSRLALLLVLSAAALICEAKLRAGGVRIGQNPGFVIRIKHEALEKFSKSVGELSSTYAHKLPIPDASCTVGGVDLETKGVRITKFPPPEFRFSTFPPNEFRGSFKIPELGFEGPFNAARRTFVTTQRDQGRFAFNASDVVVNFTITVGEFENGIPKIEKFDCASSLGPANLNIRDCKEKFASDVMGMAAKSVRPVYNSQVCSTVKRMVGSQLNQLLAKIPNVIDVSPSISLKFQFKPAFTADAFEARLHGKTITDIVSPYTPAKFVEADSSKALVVVLLSDSVFNDALYQAYENKLLEFKINKNSQPILYNLIRCDCEPGKDACLGNVIPSLKQTYGKDAGVRAEFRASKSPEVEFHQGKATFTAALIADLYMTPSNGTLEHHDTTAKVDVLGSFKVRITNGSIFGMVTVENVTVHLDDEQSKKWEDKVRGTITQIVEQYINGDLLLKGCPLKLPFGCGFSEPLVSFQPHTLQIHTGFEYKAEASGERRGERQ